MPCHRQLRLLGSTIFFVIAFFLAVALVQVQAKNKTLENAAPTNWGYWGSLESCPEGSFAAAMQLKVQGRQWRADDTALNAIKLFCATPSAPKDYLLSITSSEGGLGNWGYVYACNGLLTGFQLRSEEDLGYNADDTAAGNFRVFCSDPNTGMMEGDGMAWGNWGLENRCLTGQAICSMKTQVSILKTDYLSYLTDGVGLNNVNMECCDIPAPASNCIATDSWIVVTECDNLGGSYQTTCDFEKRSGVSMRSKDEEATWKNLGFDVNSQGTILSTQFSTALSPSPKTEHNWSNDMAPIWKEGTTSKSHFTVAPGKLTKVLQVVGSCGQFTVYSSQYKMVETDNPFEK